jgi:hypothetical protein
VWPLAVGDSARVLEIGDPGAWQWLVAAYPRTATGTYGHSWAWTGWDGEWLMPRWTAVADDWDGVHLSVAGYLATAGRALPVGKARTLLAGWNPDETYWLTDVLTPAGQAQAWHNDSDAPWGGRRERISGERFAAVDVQGLSGEERVGQGEHHGLRDVVGGADPEGSGHLNQHRLVLQ